MLSPNRSPIHKEVLSALEILDRSPLHHLRLHGSHACWRARTWNAASCEEAMLAADGVSYNPSDDGRVKWLLQFADVVEGTRRRIDQRVTDTMEFLCRMPAPFTGRHRAAGEREPQTLTQGS